MRSPHRYRATHEVSTTYRALAVLVLAGVVLGTYRYATTVAERPVGAGESGGVDAPTVLRIDPNGASASELEAVPGIGPQRARAMVAYRQRHQADSGDGLVFRSKADLRNVRGFGPATVEQAAPFLDFPDEHQGQR